MSVHAVTIKTQLKCDASGEPTGVFRYSWKCTCGKTGGWYEGGKRSGSHHCAATAASRSGDRHVASADAKAPK